MADGSTVIRVEGLSKKYLIGHKDARAQSEDTFRDALVRGVHEFGHAALAMARGRQLIQGDQLEDFWALDDVSFQVARGEVVGIIGRNGAGKSTLLKILSRITEPTKGRVVIDGRVSSLLEVGTGFHPELTGRENIFLNGAILGMSRTEISAKFDEIVAFAEIERFLDTPVKRYSSGMYVRLAFAVAAHLEPEILIVDEVLAVGDVEFQRKCLGKMQDVAERGGRTVLFVSHQMAAVQNLCSSAVVLSQGKVKFNGGCNDAIAAYLATLDASYANPLTSRRDRAGSGVLRFTSCRCGHSSEDEHGRLVSGHSAVFELTFENRTSKPLREVSFSIGIDDQAGQRLLLLYSELVDQSFQRLAADITAVEVRVPKFPLMPGRYRYTLHAAANGSDADWIKNAGAFDVEPGDFYGTGRLPPANQGTLLIEHEFRAKTPVASPERSVQVRS